MAQDELDRNKCIVQSTFLPQVIVVIVSSFFALRTLSKSARHDPCDEVPFEKLCPRHFDKWKANLSNAPHDY
eukprot:CAMPEP_0168859228 /NCGR_PEP_ID=MMETSP0727-20121128/16717_1 /TAXON_ID=265536 /ORGANISM="Amphiprora sp., Strain CCMP467" /LENGTH=71 /DNA_ID=CAMNT_0008914041 /DNA_START=53 /DNA_END=265 /DNA_ORIENTATION=-